MSLLAPAALALGLLALPIVLLYMLRLRRREQTVSSTYLWRTLVRDRAANAPWQRLRRNLLLLLQLLILAALVLALARPALRLPGLGGGSVIVLLDASASMLATDGDGAHDKLVKSGANWVWTDGSSQITETYSASVGDPALAGRMNAGSVRRR